MEGLGMMPHYLPFGSLLLSQTLLTALFGTLLFSVFVLIYNILKKSNPENGFVMFFEMGLEKLSSFIDEVGGDHFPMYAKSMAVFFFVYLFWNNLVGVVGDMFSLVVPALHHYFRPATTDITFNAVLAVVGVIGAMVFGFQSSGLHYLNKYFPIKGLGIVPKVNSVLTFFLKIFDIILGMFIGLLELIGELARIISLSLRLFGNILAGVVLLGLGVAGAIGIFKVPFLLPIVVFVVEIFVGFLQAFVFTLLIVVYFKMAGESH
ncbi:MAG: F0F1 ATP synthase subunit A [Candidatus Absconditabacteria bacterium]